MWSRLWPDTRKSLVNSPPKRQVNTKFNKEDEVPTLSHGQPFNPYSEIRVLLRHQDIVNILKVIDDLRLASAADDNLVIIWDIEHGNQLHCLQGHSRPVTSMLVHQQNKDEEYFPVLITGSSDKTIRIWHCDNGSCLSTIENHGTTVKCLVNVSDDSMFCSGGEDLCLWSAQGNLLCEEKQPTPDADVHTILPIKNDRLVLACSKPSLVVYCIIKVSAKSVLKFHSRLPAHREDIRCLIRVSDDSFASASLDGEIITWSTNGLVQLKIFNKVHEFEGLDHLFPFSVQHMLVVDQKFIFAAIGDGFSVYDAESGQCVAARKTAHRSKVSHMEVLKERNLLATCSQDGTVRLWRTTGRTAPEPELVGECLGHSGSVYMIANFGDEGFASCASDGLIILWKDGLYQRQKRMELATSLFFSPQDYTESR